MGGSVTDAELAVLGLLAEQPRHGYDIHRTIEQRGMREWTAIGFSSIYYLLDKLTKRGLVRAVTDGSSTRRAVCELTHQGREVVRVETLDPLDTRAPVHARVLRGIANSHDLTAPDVQERLRRRMHRLHAQLGDLQQRAHSQAPLPPQAQALFAYSEAMIRADITWTEHLISDERE